MMKIIDSRLIDTVKGISVTMIYTHVARKPAVMLMYSNDKMIIKNNNFERCILKFSIEVGTKQMVLEWFERFKEMYGACEQARLTYMNVSKLSCALYEICDTLEYASEDMEEHYSHGDSENINYSNVGGYYDNTK